MYKDPDPDPSSLIGELLFYFVRNLGNICFYMVIWFKQYFSQIYAISIQELKVSFKLYNVNNFFICLSQIRME